MTLARHCRAFTDRVRALQAVPERGAVTLETLVLFTTAFAILLGTAQLALWLHARNTAASAAQLGVQTATVQEGSPSRGRVAAQEHIRSVGGVGNADVTTARSATTVTVTVTASPRSLIPFISLPEIDATAAGTVERLTAP